MKPYRGKIKTTGRYGQPYAKHVLKTIPKLKGAPWYGKCIAWEFRPNPQNTLLILQAMVPLKIKTVSESATSGRFVKGVIRAGKYKGWVLSYWHLGRAVVSVGRSLGWGAKIGYIGGKYGWSGKGTGCHAGVTLQDKSGKYRKPNLLTSLKKPKKADPCAKVQKELEETRGDMEAFANRAVDAETKLDEEREENEMVQSKMAETLEEKEKRAEELQTLVDSLKLEASLWSGLCQILNSIKNRLETIVVPLVRYIRRRQNG